MEIVRKYVELEGRVKKQEEELAEIKAMLQEILQLLRGAEASEPEEIEEPENEEEEKGDDEEQEEQKQGEGTASPEPQTTVEQEPTEPEEEQKKKPTVDNPDRQEQTEPAPNLEKEVVAPRNEAIEKGEALETKEDYGYKEIVKEVIAPLEKKGAKVPTIKEISEKLKRIMK